ncbi:MAG: lytic transglycosylase domain-containing protein [Bacteroidota bacterium]|nr:lytic transglycosylase domain-containing protein [Bacteroidota bacterium]
MNNILSKILCGVFIVFTISPGLSADAALRDTTLLANNISDIPSTAKITSVIAANVVYPLSLQNNIEESIEYVKNYSIKKREYLIHTYQKGKKFFPKIAAILKHNHLPQELKILIALESGFNANAISPVGAVGYWQIMDDAAKEYGLHIANEKETNPKLKDKDDRKNLSKSTIAAAKYLRDRCKNLNNDLLLMVASYNCGVGKVWQAMKKSGNPNADFWDIKKYLPTETRNYVMNFIALNVVFENYDKFLKNKMLFKPETVEKTYVSENADKTISAETL